MRRQRQVRQQTLWLRCAERFPRGTPSVLFPFLTVAGLRVSQPSLPRVKLCVAMSVIDEVLTANETYARSHELRKLTPRPERKLAVLTCMDTRLSIRTLGLKTGDAHIIRNAGGIVTDDTLRSLIVSHHLLGTEEIMIINHTDCGLMQSSEQDLRTRIQNRCGTAAVAPATFYTFQNVEENVRHQLQKLRSHPWIPETVTVRGFVYDVASGLLREIKNL